MQKYANSLPSNSDSDIGDDEYNSSGSDAQVGTCEHVPKQQLSTFAQSGTNVLSSSREEWTIRLTDGDVHDLLSLKISGTILTTGDRPWLLWASMIFGFVKALLPS